MLDPDRLSVSPFKWDESPRHTRTSPSTALNQEMRIVLYSDETFRNYGTAVMAVSSLRERDQAFSRLKENDICRSKKLSQE
jgi:hypothetical protein